MKLVSCQSPDDVAEKFLTHLKARVEAVRGPLRMFFPTGQTPLPSYAKMAQEKEFWSKAVVPIQIDEFVGPQKIFQRDLRKHLVEPLGLKAGHFIDGLWTDKDFSKHMVQVLSEPIHGAALGMGPNGHVGFQEPGAGGAEFMGGRVHIAEASRVRVAGAATNEAFTFGVGAFMKAQEVYLLVTGESKRLIFKMFMKQAPSAGLPATLLKNHPRLYVFTDLMP